MKTKLILIPILFLCFLSACTTLKDGQSSEGGEVLQYLKDKYPKLWFEVTQPTVGKTIVNGKTIQFSISEKDDVFVDTLDEAILSAYRDKVIQHVRFRLMDYFSDITVEEFGPNDVAFGCKINTAPPIGFRVTISGASLCDTLNESLQGKTVSVQYLSPSVKAGDSSDKKKLAGLLQAGAKLVIENAAEDAMGAMLSGFITAKSDSYGSIEVPVLSLLVPYDDTDQTSLISPTVVQANTQLRLFPYPGGDVQSTMIAGMSPPIREAAVMLQMAVRGEWGLVLTTPEPWMIGSQPWGWVKLSQLRPFDETTSHQGWLKAGSHLYDGEEKPDVSSHTEITTPLLITIVKEEGDFLLVNPLTDKACWTKSCNLLTRNPFERLP